MGMEKQIGIAQELGSQFTLYAVMRSLGIELSPEQERRQEYLEKNYPAREQPEQLLGE